MRLIAFEDKCVIKRNTDGYDEYDNPLQEIVYEGKCHFQEGGQTNAQRMYVRNPIVFISDVSVLIDPNDTIEVITKFSRKWFSIVNTPREMELPITHQRVTRLELKQATE